MPKSGISNSEVNQRKREDFYNDLCEISFDFEINPSESSTNELARFIRDIGTSALQLKNLCDTTMKSRKGSTTRKHLILISNCADKLYDSLNKIISKRLLYVDDVHVAFKDFKYLCDALSKTSKAHFPHIINKSTLDYDLTRKKCSDLSKELEFCKYQLLAITDGVLGDFILQTLNSNEQSRTVRITIIDDKGKPIDVNNRQTHSIQTIIRILKNLKKYKNFDTVINGLQQKLPESNNSETAWCSKCSKELPISTLLKQKCRRCHSTYYFCIDCLKNMAAKGRYKCRFGHTLDKETILDFIKKS